MVLRLRPRQKSLRGSFLHRLLGAGLFESRLWIPRKKTFPKSVSTGVFIGMLPLVGLQSFLSVLAAYFLKANIPVTFMSTFVSNPFTVGALILAQIKLGQKLVPSLAVADPMQHLGMVKYFSLYGKPLLVGSGVTAVVGGALAYPAGIWIWKIASAARLRRLEKSARS